MDGYPAPGASHPPGRGGAALAAAGPVLALGAGAGLAVALLPRAAAVALLAGVTLLLVLARLGRGGRRARLERASGAVRGPALMAALLEEAPEATLVLAADGRITYASPSSTRVLGRAPAALVGRPGGELVPHEERARLEAAIGRLTTPGHAPFQSEWPVAHPDGRNIWIEAIGVNRLGDPSVAGLVLSLRDVTERHETHERLRHQAFHDSLTGLANRALFQDRVEHALARARRGRGSVWVAFMDLDDFKSINDTLGHGAGDRLLRRVAAAIHGCLRPSDTAARLGGDEFAVLLEEVAHPDEAVRVAERLREAVALTAEAAAQDAGQEVLVRSSVGLANSREETGSAADLIRDADIALYAAKGSGKGGLMVFEPTMFDAARERLDLREDLRRALESEQFHLVFQPVIDLHTGAVQGLEALLRWDHPDHGGIPPTTFIPIAEETGLIAPIGRWVLERALRQLRLLDAAGYREVRMGVNVSATQFAAPDFAGDVRDALAQCGVRADRLVLELTESALLGDEVIRSRTFQALRGLGVQLALDDFGTGYSSLARVRQLPLHALKIDRSFIAAVGDGLQDRALLRSIVELGHSLGLRVIAEGVETREQHEAVGVENCDLGQGYLYAHPVEADQLRPLLDRLAGKWRAVRPASVPQP